MRSAKVYYKETLAGKLIETNEGEFVFQYDEQYVKSHPDDFITFTMPVTNNPNDRMGLLLACCRHCIGAVSVVPISEENE